MANCNSCGNPLANNAAFCGNCGTPINNVATPPPVNSSQGNMVPPQMNAPQQPPMGAPQPPPQATAPPYYSNTPPQPGAPQQPMGNPQQPPPGAPPYYSNTPPQPGAPTYHNAPTPPPASSMKKPSKALGIGCLVIGLFIAAIYIFSSCVLPFMIGSSIAQETLEDMTYAVAENDSDTDDDGFDTRSFPQAESENTTDSTDSGLNWVIEPQYDWQNLAPLSNTSEYIDYSMNYLNFYTNDGIGVLEFSGSELIPAGTFTEPPFFCDYGYWHGFPEDLYNSDFATQNVFLASYGLPYTTDGGHGGANYMISGYNPSDGSLTLGFAEYGEFYAADFSTYDFTVPDYLTAIDITNFDESGMLLETRQGLATGDGNLILDVVYTSVTKVYNNIWRVEANDGMYSFFNTAENTFLTDFVLEPVWNYNNPVFMSTGLFNEGYSPVRINGMVGFIDENGNEVITPQFENATFVKDGVAWVQQDGLWGQIALPPLS